MDGEEWHRWGEREVGAGRAEEAARAAMEVLAIGLSGTAAACAGRLAGGIVLPAEVETVRQEKYRMDLVLDELGRLGPTGQLTEAALDEARRIFDARAAALQGIVDRAQALWLEGSRPAVAGVRSPSLSTSAPRPSLSQFLAEQSILLISYSGAFLLIVAALLFELYGNAGMSGWLRFGAVLALDVIFGGAALACFEWPRLRLVGRTYLAIFALMVPLVLAAGYHFLLLDQEGISIDLAVACSGLACTVLYGLLAIRLDSRSYAALALLALPVGWVGMVDLLALGPWRGVASVPLMAIYAGGASRAAGQRRWGRLLQTHSEILVHLAAAFSVGWTLFLVADDLTWFDVGSGGLQLGVALVLASVGYILHRLLTGHLRGLVVAAVAIVVGLLSLNSWLRLGQAGAALEMLASAVAYTLAATWTRSPILRGYLRSLVMVLALPCALEQPQPDALQATILLAATGLLVGIALQTRTPAWLYGAGAVFAVDWYWLAATLLPAPANPGPEALVLVYTPLPALLAAAGLGIRLATPGLRWALPLYLMAGAGSLIVGLAAAVNGDVELTGRALAGYALLAYTLGAVDRLWPALVLAWIEAAMGLAALLAAGSAPVAWGLLAFAGLAWLIYCGRFAWAAAPGSTRDLITTHRAFGLGLMGMVALAAFAAWNGNAGSPQMMTGLLVIELFAAMLVVESFLQDWPVLEYVAAGVASLGGIWIAGDLGATNPQWYVALPGLVAIGAGLKIRFDQRIGSQATASGLMTGSGAGLLMACSGFQSLASDQEASLYTTLMAVEGVVAILVGIGTRNRALAVTGTGGFALAALRALLLLFQTIPLYEVFGLLAILLLVVGAGLTLGRDSLKEAAASLRDSWRHWP